MSYCTLIYGLNIQLNHDIPGVVPNQSPKQPPDIVINFGFFPPWFDAENLKRKLWYVRAADNVGELPRLSVWEINSHDAYHFYYADGTQFLIDSAATEVWAIWPNTLTVEDTATYLLGPIMGFALLLRGYVSLHASAIAVQGSAIAFVGPAGAGKSTTAAALANFGYHVITEDVVTLRQIDNSFYVEPGYPCIRLWPESVTALYGSNADLPRLTPTWDKRFLDLTQKEYRFQNDPLQLRAIYLIDNRVDSKNAPFINSISQPDALLSLVANTYAQYLMNKEMRAREFNVLSRLLKTVTVRRLVPHSDPASITSLCETVIDDIDSLNFGNGTPKSQATSFHV